MSINSASAFQAINKDPHTLVLEAREMIGGLAAISSASSGPVETLTAEHLFYLFASIYEKLDIALFKMEAE
ncbi:hypothetical protein [Photobacterium galatheae]|uniref:Uncharacterized protein n=1 Tax=Photobacterium galatheae TaxID=1654360 RepID=A0A066RSP4_9GAMM|nr:hypothetical protein [Photobacterium galatheae]KDM93374.1 hypothetical protein EA58_00445 [Photobacterium galatheae]MCM0146954.1 hypothetical protein [Photobacterium galatheae]